MFKVGVTVGKFMPMHAGHEFMIETALAKLDRIVVLVSGNEDDEIPLIKRFNLINKKYEKDPRVVVKYHHDKIGSAWNVDEYGTVTDTKFWELWTDEFKRLTREYTLSYFVSSDRYGKVAAEWLGIDWLPIDPERVIFPISATMIRENPRDFFDMISDEFKPMYTKRIVFVGPESTGKSTMAEAMTLWFGGIFIPEYGRILSEGKNNDLTKSDFYDILKMHRKFIDSTVSISDGLQSIDTEAFTTYLYGKKYLNEDLTTIRDIAKNEEFDLYVLMKPNIPWHDDGTRVMPDQSERDEFFDEMKFFLEENGKKYVVVDKKTFNGRYLQTIDLLVKEGL